MAQFPQLIDARVLTPTVTALAMGFVTELELLRLKTLARWYARGLPPDVNWEDLLQEALTRILVGARRAPEAVPAVAFVAGVMRSLRSEHWQGVRRAWAGSRRATPRARPASAVVEADPGPERALMAQQELAAIRALFAEDVMALTILDGLTQGLTAEEIRRAAGWSDTDYASARKRMRRVLLREGLTCTPR